VIATGETRTVRSFVDTACSFAGMPLTWRGSEDQEYAFDASGTTRVRVSPEFYRPAEVDILQGNAQRAQSELGWRCEYSFDQLIDDMMHDDLACVMEKRGMELRQWIEEHR